MAKAYQGINGQFSGKVGPNVGRVRSGVQMLSIYQPKVRNPKTEKQLLHRAHFSLLGIVSRAFLPATKIGFAKAKGKLGSGFSHFMKKNWDAVSGSTPAEMDVDYAQLTVSDGLLPMPGFGSARMDEALTVDVSFTPNSDDEGASAADKVYIFVYQADGNVGVLSKPVLRSTGAVSMTVPIAWSGLKVHVYGFAVGDGPNNAEVRSESAYLGNGTIV